MALAVRNPHQIKAFIPIAGATYPIENIEPIYSLIRIPIIGRGFAAVWKKKNATLGNVDVTPPSNENITPWTKKQDDGVTQTLFERKGQLT